MGAPRIRRVAFTCNTTSGNQDITLSGFGTPQAAIFIISGAAGTSATAHGRVGIGWTDGTNSYAAGAAAEDAAATTNTARQHGSGQVIGIPDVSGAGTLFYATFVSWITDGVRINWPAGFAPGSAFHGEVILIAGADNVTAGSVSLGTGTAAINTTLGYNPDLVLTAGVGVSTGVTTTAKIAFGAWARSSNTQACHAWADTDAQVAATTTAGLMSNTYGYMEANVGSMQYGVTLAAIANGFSSTPSASAGDDKMPYLALNFGGTAAHVECAAGPSATGSYSKTGLSFKPGFLLTTTGVVSDTPGTSDTTGAASFCFTTQDGFGGSWLGGGDLDGVGTSVAKSHRAADVEREYGDSAGAFATLVERTFTSFNADGWTKNQTSGTTSLYYLSLAVQANAGVPLFMHHRTQQGMS